MPAAAQPPEARQARDDLFRRTAGLQITVLVGEADHGVRVGDVNVLRLRARWIKGNTKGKREVRREHR